MLIICSRISQLRWSELMAVYAEGNLENGRDLYGHLPQGQQILRAEEDFYSYLHHDFFRCAAERYFIWEENGRYISALRMHPFEDGLLVEALETRPEFRKKGYATQLLQAVIEQLQPEKLYSHIGKKNAASIATHQKCGFRKILDFSRYGSGEINTFCHTYLYEKNAG
jgi:GNAT superfamily N-acetyltransferase